MRHPKAGPAWVLVLAAALAACGAQSTPTGSLPTRSTSAASAAPVPSATTRPSEPAPAGRVVPAPGSDSAVYGPNPAAILVAIDPGHGGCLDWGVPDPSERGVELAEKTLTLEIAERLRGRLEDEGIGVLMIREADEALAGDLAPEFGCEGPAWRDVDGDGEAGFEETGRIRTRDELQARIDRANLARADAFVSIHINALTENGVVFEIAATQTFYDDETPWGASASARLAEGLQTGVVAGLDRVATYERQDRGTEAVAYYAISRTWDPATDTCEVPDDEWCKPHRGLQMPSALAEVGSITSREEHDLLASGDGQEAIAEGLYQGLVGFFADRPASVRITLDGADADDRPQPVDGDGPPFRAPDVPGGPVRLRVTNTGTEAIESGARIVAGWQASDAPYLPAAPSDIAPVGPSLPPLEPGEAVVVEIELPAPPTEAPALAWISLMQGAEPIADAGSPALQLASRPS